MLQTQPLSVDSPLPLRCLRRARSARATSRPSRRRGGAAPLPYPHGTRTHPLPPRYPKPRERTDDTTARLERESNTSSLHELSEDLATAAAAAEAPLTQEALAAAAGAAERLPLDFVLCLGAHSMRDEDLFGELLP